MLVAYNYDVSRETTVKLTFQSYLFIAVLEVKPRIFYRSILAFGRTWINSINDYDTLGLRSAVVSVKRARATVCVNG